MKFIIPLALIFLFSCKKKLDHPTANNYSKTTVVYKSIPGVNSNLLSLDIYHFNDVNNLKPVVVYIHGGGWSIGDKAQQLDNKLGLFYGLNYIFISINYRLSPNPTELNNTTRVKFPDHNNDVADAVQWIIKTVKNYGGNPDKIVVLGHSAGAHLASLTGTSPSFLPSRGIALTKLKGIASFDTEGYDVPSQIEEDLYENAFGTDPIDHLAASPSLVLSDTMDYPLFFIAKRGDATRIGLANDFIECLKSVGATVYQVDGSVYSHSEINTAIGSQSDKIITPPLIAFLHTCFQ